MPFYSRLLRRPRRSFFLFGPRGTGKSTWARTTCPDAHRVDLLDEALYHSLLADPSLFAAEIFARPRGSWVVVDEVQRIPGLLHEVHRFIEERGLRFALLGSSARRLKTQGTNLLAGRAVWRTMYPLVPAELGTDFDLERALRHGTIPLVWCSDDPAETLAAYVRLYLREEIRAEALVRGLAGFVRFLPVAGLFHGQVVNVAGIARDAGVARTTVTGYLDILEDTLLAWRLPAFEGRLRVRERRHPKLYWVDPGLARAIKGQLGPVGVEERGALFEGWVLTLLRAHDEAEPLFDSVRYWAPTQATGTEVDFLLERRGEFLAIEVKSGARFSNADLRGLRALAELPRVVRRVLVFTGGRRLRTEDGIDVWPVQELLTALAGGRLWP